MLARRLIGRTAAGGWNPGLLTDASAWWRMLSEDLTADATGKGNILTNINDATACTALKENLGCADVTNPKSFQILDGDLKPGFPLKDGEANRSFSFCTWFIPDVLANYFIFAEKREGGTGLDRSFWLITYNDAIRFYVYDSTGAYTIFSKSDLVEGHLYHLGVTFDGNNGPNFPCRIRLWDDTVGEIVGEDTTDTTTKVINIKDATLKIGSGSGSNGRMAGAVMLPFVATQAQIDQIRQGTYGL